VEEHLLAAVTRPVVLPPLLRALLCPPTRREAFLGVEFSSSSIPRYYIARDLSLPLQQHQWGLNSGVVVRSSAVICHGIEAVSSKCDLFQKLANFLKIVFFKQDKWIFFSFTFPRVWLADFPCKKELS